MFSLICGIEKKPKFIEKEHRLVVSRERGLQEGGLEEGGQKYKSIVINKYSGCNVQDGDYS